MKQAKGFDASLLEIGTAYEQHFGKKMPGDMPYLEGGKALVADMGNDKAHALILKVRDEILCKFEYRNGRCTSPCWPKDSQYCEKHQGGKSQ